jgi:hypothetical protein
MILPSRKSNTVVDFRERRWAYLRICELCAVENTTIMISESPDTTLGSASGGYLKSARALRRYESRQRCHTILISGQVGVEGPTNGGYKTREFMPCREHLKRNGSRDLKINRAMLPTNPTLFLKADSPISPGSKPRSPGWRKPGPCSKKLQLSSTPRASPPPTRKPFRSRAFWRSSRAPRNGITEWISCTGSSRRG